MLFFGWPQFCLTHTESRSGASLAAHSATRILTPSALRLTAFVMGTVKKRVPSVDLINAPGIDTLIASPSPYHPKTGSGTRSLSCTAAAASAAAADAMAARESSEGSMGDAMARPIDLDFASATNLVGAKGKTQQNG